MSVEDWARRYVERLWDKRLTEANERAALQAAVTAVTEGDTE